MLDFYIKNREPFRSLTKNCLKLNKNESIVSAVLVFVVYKSAVSAVQKSKYVGCFNFLQRRLVFAHLLPDTSIKSTKLHVQSWRKISPMISLYFRKITAKVSINHCAKRH